MVAADVYNTAGYQAVAVGLGTPDRPSWFYRVIVEDILGVSLKAGTLSFNPCVPSAWKQFEVTLKYKSSTYRVHVENAGVEHGITSVTLDGKTVAGGRINLADDGQSHRIVARMGRVSGTLPTAASPG